MSIAKDIDVLLSKRYTSDMRTYAEILNEFKNRRHRIYEDYHKHGLRIVDLTKKYGLTRARIDKILREEKAKEQAVEN